MAQLLCSSYEICQTNPSADFSALLRKGNIKNSYTGPCFSNDKATDIRNGRIVVSRDLAVNVSFSARGLISISQCHCAVNLECSTATMTPAQTSPYHNRTDSVPIYTQSEAATRAGREYVTTGFPAQNAVLVSQRDPWFSYISLVLSRCRGDDKT